jgi:hypothetical protein
MINHNESDLRRQGIEPGSPDSQSNALSIERLQLTLLRLRLIAPSPQCVKTLILIG